MAKLKAEYKEQIKHYATQLNKTEEDIIKEIEAFGTTSYPDITDKALVAHIWGTERNLSLPLKTIIPGVSEKYFLLQNLPDLAKKGTKNVNVRGYIVAELTSKRGNPRIVLIDESGLIFVNINSDTKDRWQTLGIQPRDAIYVQPLNIWKPKPEKEEFVYNISQFTSISKVPEKNDLQLPAFADIKSTPIKDIKEGEIAFIQGWVTAARTNSYLGCSNCRKKPGTVISEGNSFICDKCHQQSVSTKMQIKQIGIGDNSGDDIICTLPPQMSDENIDLLKGIAVALIGHGEKRDDRDMVFRINIMLKNKESKSLDQQYKNASGIAVKYIPLQPSAIVKKDQFANWLTDRFPGLSSDGLIQYMLKNELIIENGAFLKLK